MSRLFGRFGRYAWYSRKCRIHRICGGEGKARILKVSSLYVCTSRDEGGWTISSYRSHVGWTSRIRNKISTGCCCWRVQQAERLDDFNSNSISKNVVSLLQDKSTWTKLSINAMKFSRKFNWDNTAAVTLALPEKAKLAKTSRESKVSVGNYYM